MELSKSKLKYINHGHTPYFKNILTEDLGSADFLPVCFDESINKTNQNCEMDLVLRYWDNIEKKRQPKSKRPDSKSCNVVVKAVNDQLTVAKLSLFIYVAGFLKPYLKKYQTDMPIITCMYDDLQKIIKTILELINNTDVIAKCQTLSKIGISDRNNFKKMNKINRS